MQYVILSIAAYLFFNMSVWLSIGKSGMVGMALANLIGAGFTALFFRSELYGKVRWPAALMGSFGILLIVLGLLGSHTYLPVSLSVEAVYNGFAISSWPLFVVLGTFWSAKFTERPNWFDLGCHLAMATMVAARFLTYPGQYDFSIAGVTWIVVAIVGYALFNISIKLSVGHRPTNIMMNIGGAVLLVVVSLLYYGRLNVAHLEWKGVVLGGLAILAIVWSLGKAYGHFGNKNQASLVAPLVYDGLLVVAPLLSFFTKEEATITNAVLVGLGMLFITFIRYQHHARRK